MMISSGEMTIIFLTVSLLMVIAMPMCSATQPMQMTELLEHGNYVTSEGMLRNFTLKPPFSVLSCARICNRELGCAFFATSTKSGECRLHKGTITFKDMKYEEAFSTFKLANPMWLGMPCNGNSDCPDPSTQRCVKNVYGNLEHAKRCIRYRVAIIICIHGYG